MAKTLRKYWKAFLVLTSCAVAVLLVAGIAQGRWLESSQMRATIEDVPVKVLQSEISPNPSFFGEEIQASFTFVVDASRVDAKTLFVTKRFDPYRVTSSTVRERRSGTYRYFTYRYALQCLEQTCVDSFKTKAFRFTPATVQYALRKEREPQHVRVFWPAVGAASNLTTADISTLKAYLKETVAEGKASSLTPFWMDTELPEPTFRWRSDTYPWVLWGVAIVLFAVGFSCFVSAAHSLLQFSPAAVSKPSERERLRNALQVAIAWRNGEPVEEMRRDWALGVVAEAAKNIGLVEEAEVLEVYAYGHGIHEPDEVVGKVLDVLTTNFKEKGSI